VNNEPVEEFFSPFILPWLSRKMQTGTGSEAVSGKEYTAMSQPLAFVYFHPPRTFIRRPDLSLRGSSMFTGLAGGLSSWFVSFPQRHDSVQ
jgi:hypothetical protein